MYTESQWPQFAGTLFSSLATRMIWCVLLITSFFLPCEFQTVKQQRFQTPAVWKFTQEDTDVVILPEITLRWRPRLHQGHRFCQPAAGFSAIPLQYLGTPELENVISSHYLIFLILSSLVPVNFKNAAQIQRRTLRHSATCKMPWWFSYWIPYPCRKKLSSRFRVCEQNGNERNVFRENGWNLTR